jgi:hypothetical protein
MSERAILLSRPDWRRKTHKSTAKAAAVRRYARFSASFRVVMPATAAGDDDADTRHRRKTGTPYKFPSTCDQIAIMPTNKASEVSAAAS